MARSLAAGLAVLFAVLCVAATSPAPTDAASPSLVQALASALRSPDLDRSRSAALAVDLETGRTVFSENADLALAPASVEKLAISFAALRVLGPRYRFRTDVVGAGEVLGRVWRGDVYLVGGGDPTLSPADLDRLARAVAALGIRRIDGRVHGDERRFDTKRAALGWMPSFLGIEARPLSALSVAGVPPGGPNGSAAAAARAFVSALERRGIRVDGLPGTGRVPSKASPLARDVSEPLSLIARRMNADSDNFVAETVLKELGASLGVRGSTRAGARVVRQALADAGVPLAGVRIADGSGLSRLDRLSATALVSILRTGLADPVVRRAFMGSLAVAGVSGTLKRRLDRRPTRKRVVGKTGTTSRASALAGFVGRRYVFAVLQNGSPVPYWSARAAQDRFVVVLAGA